MLHLDPFSEQYICPYCDWLDTGRFCSNCGRELLISRDDLAFELAKRLMIFGFRPFAEWIAENQELAEIHDFASLLINNGQVLCKEDQPSNGLRLQLVFIIDQDSGGEQYLTDFIGEYIRIRALHIGKVNGMLRHQRPKSWKYYLESLNFRGYIIKGVPAAENIGQSLQKRRIRIRTGVWAGLLKKLALLPHIIRSSFHLKVRTDIAILNYQNGVLYSASRAVYDIPKHQAKVIAAQSREHDAAAIPKHTHPFLEVLYAVFDSFRDYFKILVQYFQNPSYFPDLIAMRNVIPLKKILALYFTGLICSVTLPWLLTGGYLNSSKLSLFSNLPPFLADLAELGTDMLGIAIVCLLLHIIMRVFGRKGKLSTLLLCFLFYYSFIQIPQRTLRYFTGPWLLKRLNFDYHLQLFIQAFVLGALGILTIYFVFPIVYSVYRAKRAVIGVAFLIIGFIVGFTVSIVFTGLTIFHQAKFGAEVDYRNLQVFYTGAVYKEEAIRLMYDLSQRGFGAEQRAAVQLLRDDSSYTVKMVLNTGVKVDSNLRQEFTELAVSLSYRVFNGSIVRLQLCNSCFRSLYEFKMPPASRLTLHIDTNYIIEYPQSWNFEPGDTNSQPFIIASADSMAAIVLGTENLDTALGVGAYTELTKKQLKKKFGKELINLQDTLEMHDDRPCHRLIYTIESLPDVKRTRSESYIWVINKKAFVLAFVSLDRNLDSDRLAIASVILNSFTIQKH